MNEYWAEQLFLAIVVFAIVMWGIIDLKEKIKLEKELEKREIKRKNKKTK
jgi:hypothetical protein